VRFETETMSSPGGRAVNQDRCGFVASGRFGCWVLADGLGGHRGGEVASQIAVDVALESFSRDPGCSLETLQRCLDEANRAILDRQAGEPALADMRTTAVILVSDSEVAWWAHMGDSRLYWLSRGRVSAETKDHSVPQALCDAGEITRDQIRFHEDRNRLLKSLGSPMALRATIAAAPVGLAAGDALLLASDGFWEYVTEVEIEAELAKVSAAGDWLRRMEARLLARVSGKHDNYTAIGILVLAGAAVT